MRSNFAIICCLISTILIFTVGCEPEDQTPASSEDTQQTTEASQEEMQLIPTETQEQAEAETEVIIEPSTLETLEKETTSDTSPDKVLVIVNGTEITQAQAEELIAPRLEQLQAQAAGRRLPPGYLEQTKQKLIQQAIEGMIAETLIDEQIEKHDIVITDEETQSYVENMAAREGMTAGEIEALITASGKSFEQWKEDMKFDKRIAVLKLAEMEGLGTIDVNEADALEYYNANKKSFEQPEQVRASHILINSDGDPNAAKAQAQELLKQIKEGADFAELAREYSSCPSSERGGDLGFAQQGAWVKPFSDAAFALQPGEISDVVETQFGYHIVKVTDRKEAGLTSFEDAKQKIIDALRAQKEGQIGAEYVNSLKENAQIVYPEDK